MKKNWKTADSDGTLTIYEDSIPVKVMSKSQVERYIKEQPVDKQLKLIDEYIELMREARKPKDHDIQ